MCAIAKKMQKRLLRIHQHYSQGHSLISIAVTLLQNADVTYQFTKKQTTAAISSATLFYDT